MFSTLFLHIPIYYNQIPHIFLCLPIPAKIAILWVEERGVEGWHT